MSTEDRCEEAPRQVFVWQWWCEGSQCWEDYQASEWPTEEWARRLHPTRYNATPEGHPVRLVWRIITDRVLES